jgi:hypothetical protein
MTQVAPLARQLQEALRSAKSGHGSGGLNCNENILGDLISTIVSNLVSSETASPDALVAVAQALDAAVGQLMHSLTLQPVIPEGWQLVKSSRLAEIAKLTIDPSQPAYEGRCLWDQQKVHANWDACRANLDSVREQIEAINDGSDNDELLEALKDDAAKLQNDIRIAQPIAHLSLAIGHGAASPSGCNNPA